MLVDSTKEQMMHAMMDESADVRMSNVRGVYQNVSDRQRNRESEIAN
jgi:hypothetical protein